MKKMILGAVTASLLLVSSLSAAPSGACRCDPCMCNPCECGPCPRNAKSCCTSMCDCLDGHFEIGAEAIFLRPTVCDTNYAVADPRAYVPSTLVLPPYTGTPATMPQGKQKSVSTDYSWGFRVMAGYVFEGGCNDAQVQYTGLHTRDTGTFTVDGTGGLWPSFGHPRYLSESPNLVFPSPGPLFNSIDNAALIGDQLPAFARSHVRWDYDAVDLTMGSRSMKGCDMWVRGFVGLHYANILNRTIVEYQGTFNPGQAADVAPPFGPQATTLQSVISNKRNLWGIGPKLGVESRYYVGCGFGIGAKLAIALIAGETDANFIQENLMTVLGLNGIPPLEPTVIAQTLNARYSSTTRVVPVLETRLGVNYTWCCGDCFTFFGEIGYEFTSYINAFARTTFNDQGGTQSQNCYSFNLDGLYLRGQITF